MNNFGSYMLNNNPNRPDNANNVMVVSMSRSEEGYWVMTATWDGGENTKPVFFGSDEMMTLTDAEREARDTMVGALTPADEQSDRIKQLIEAAREEDAAEARAEAEAAAKAKAEGTRRGLFIFSCIGWGLVALLYAFTNFG